MSERNGRRGQEEHAKRQEFIRSRLEAGRGFLEEGRFADAAQAFMVEAEFTYDGHTRQMRLEAAKICASLHLADAIKESSATHKETARTTSASTQELSATIKKATNVLHADLRNKDKESQTKVDEATPEVYSENHA